MNRTVEPLADVGAEHVARLDADVCGDVGMPPVVTDVLLVGEFLGVVEWEQILHARPPSKRELSCDLHYRLVAPPGLAYPVSAGGASAAVDQGLRSGRKSKKVSTETAAMIQTKVDVSAPGMLIRTIAGTKPV